MADTAAAGRRMWCSVPERMQLHVAMLALQLGYAGFHVVSRAALNMGISKIVFIVYRNVIAFLLLLPFAYFLEKKKRPAITLNFLLQFFLLALVGITANQGFYLLGLDNTSPTFASAIQNSVPAITFLMAVILRIEKVRLDGKDGIAKVGGTIFCVVGASIITLYKGPTIYSPVPQLNRPSLGNDSKNWTLGCVFLIGLLLLRGPRVCGGLPTGSDPCCGDHGLCRVRRAILLRRNHWGSVHHHGALPCSVGEKRGVQVRKEGGGGTKWQGGGRVTCSASASSDIGDCLTLTAMAWLGLGA